MIRRRRLGGEYVQSRSGEMAAFQGVDEKRLINQTPSRSDHQDGTPFHASRVDDPFRLERERQMERNDIGHREQRVELRVALGPGPVKHPGAHGLEHGDERTMAFKSAILRRQASMRSSVISATARLLVPGRPSVASKRNRTFMQGKWWSVPDYLLKSLRAR